MLNLKEGMLVVDGCLTGLAIVKVGTNRAFISGTCDGIFSTSITDYCFVDNFFTEYGLVDFFLFNFFFLFRFFFNNFGLF